MQLTTKERQEYERYLAQKKRIASATAPLLKESGVAQEKRVARLLSTFEEFCQFYFPHYCTAPFAWFHKRAAKAITDDPTIFAVLEFPREHAKSVFADIMLPMYLNAHGKLNGMMLGSANHDKAAGLLHDIQAELESNKRYIADYGEQYSFGDWSDDTFVTKQGIGFWAFGRGESPRGTREGERRPNYGVIDDIDDKEIVKNDARVQEAVDWVLGDFYGALEIKESRLVVAGNRIHQKSILAHLVGDVNDGDPVNPDIYHLKVYALENPKTHREDQSESGVPAWKENYTRQHIQSRMAKMGYRNAQREFFHKHITEGLVFKNEWMKYVRLPKLSSYAYIVTYNDPSFKDTKKNDYKAIVAVGRVGHKFHLIDCWVAQATTGAMVQAHYDMHERLTAAGATLVTHYFEANFIQDLLADDYRKEAEARGYDMAIRKDERKKPDKFGRIENLTPLFERGLVEFNEAIRGTVHFRAFLDQLLGFPNAHDDGPDAFEGAVFILNQKTRTEVPMTVGTRRRRNDL